MHLSEGILPLKQVIITSCIAIPCVVDGYRKFQKSSKSNTREDRKPFITMAFALCFALTLLPVPVPIAGASSHMCATPLLALILGPRITVFPVFCILLLQAIFFAHGGLTTLGANVLTLGVVGPWVTLLVSGLLSRFKISSSICIGLSCFIGSLSVYFSDTLLLSWALAHKQHFLNQGLLKLL